MPRELRILVATPRFAPQVGGAETWTREVVAGLARRAHRVVVVARAADGPSGKGFGESAIVHRIGGSRMEFSSAVVHSIARMKPDAVIAQYSALPPAVAAARGRRVPSLGIVHDIYGFEENLRTRGRVRGALRWVGLERSLAILPPDAFLVPSRVTAEGVARSSDAPITVVPAGADHVPRSPAREARDGGRSFVFVGRLVPTKGVAALVEAVLHLRDRGLDVRLSVVGAGPEEEALREAAAGSGAISFEGTLEDEELDPLIRGSVALVLPSGREGWGLAITEAAARGVPYIAYDIPAVREQHAMLHGGLLVQPGAEYLAEGMRRLVEGPEMAAGLGAAGREAATHMRWDTAAEVVETAIFAAIGRRAKG